MRLPTVRQPARYLRKLGGPIETMGESNLMYLSMTGHEIDNNNQLICTVQMITNIIINGLALMRVFDESEV